MPRVRSINVYQHVSYLGNNLIAAYRNCGLSYRSIAARVDRDPMTVSRIRNRWVQDDNTERRAGSQRPPTTSSQEAAGNKHVTHMALMNLADTSRAQN
ncbi:HTH_Tnp_Tc3_2 domain-containing protein [Trichonephila clavipes]|nr:HTH_Tnp_Tc3_2 domain-containing protein [Trichonephila clavipes]